MGGDSGVPVVSVGTESIGVRGRERLAATLVEPRFQPALDADGIRRWWRHAIGRWVDDPG